MAFDGKEGEQISITEAAALTANYRSANPNGKKAHFIGKNILNSILAQTGCVGIRIYYGLDDNSVQEIVLVGADSNERDLYNGIIADRTKPCPPYCDGNNSPLNG